MPINHTGRTNISEIWEHPPKGTWFRQNGVGFEVGAATRSVTAVLFGVFMGLWSIFPLCGTYATVKANPGQLKEVIIFSLFTVLWDLLALIWVFGKVEIRVNKQGGVILTGLGRLALKRRFDWKDVSAIRIIDGGECDRISIEGKRRINFGTRLASERQKFIVAALSHLRRHFQAVGSTSTPLSQRHEGG